MRDRWAPLVVAVLGLVLASGGAHAQRRRVGEIRIISSTTGATVAIDGQEVGVIPIDAPLEVRAGDHALQITKRGYTSYNEELHVRPGQSRDIEVDLLPLAGFLRVRSSQTDVRVFVDGNFIGNAPVDFDLPPGAHSIKASRPGYQDFLRNVNAEAGAEINLEAQLVELPPESNPYRQRPPRPARWYEKSWVWVTVGAVVVAAAAVTVGVAVAGSGESQLDGFCNHAPPCTWRGDIR